MLYRFTLPDALYRRASAKAKTDGRELAAVLLEALERYLGDPPKRLSGAQIAAVRKQLKENRSTFGARFGRSGRTVEGWEQELHEPDPITCREIALLKVK